MSRSTVIDVLIGAAVLVTAATPSGAQAPPEPGDRPVVGLAVRDDIRVVYQIKTDEWKDGIGAGLHYLDKLLDTYEAEGIALDAVELHGVFHGDAAFHLLVDAAWREHTGEEGDNPNAEPVAELLRRGAEIEICAQTMKSKGWDGDDVLPGVAIVAGAYPRIIDLQLRGHASIRF